MPARRPFRTAAAILCSGPLLTHPAFAEEACCPAPQDAAFAALTGDWGGIRSTLKQNGVELFADYTGEVFGNPSGGKKRGLVFNGLFKLALDLDLQKTVGWPDASFRVSGLSPHGTSGTLRDVGDASVFSSIDAYDSLRLNEFWVEQRLFEGKASLRVGQMPVDTEFGLTDVGALFINSSYGVPSPPITPMPFAAYPVAALGLRLKVEPVKGLYGMAGVYDGNPSPGDFPDPTDGTTAAAKRHGTDWALRASEGTFYAGEVGFQRSEGTFPGTYRLGLLHHSDAFADVRKGAAATHRGSTSGYYGIDQTVWQKSEGSKEGVSAFLRGTLAEEKTSTMSDSLQMGAVYTGLFSTEDKLGVAFARNKFSPGQSTVIDGQEYQPNSETVAELTYLLPLRPSLRVQPDLQYIHRPGGHSAFPNAWILGVRATVDF
jgi:porin